MSQADELAAERETDLQEIEAHFNNNQFSHATGNGVCTPTMSRAGEPLFIGGKQVTIRRTLFARCSLFTAAPVQKQPITFNAAEYRIAEVNTTGDGVHYEIALTGINEL